ncbi:high-affinity zinc ABC transporter ATP-binding protein [Aeromonas diversa CDC 2478-85]|uniref:High-affinity zinc ABC transporter ATP-binding protein n=1 Tax=Aeromonas diversa CDC 2478-85 TaxID=1268237 RepID=N9VPC6_9GAMM|nr:zinc ABC transporter ATP-binding protein ZnuC [Aeromonas diversa]ENY73176.1 high-affinity zinc ABC transporter ATP-binding protein [Aeromonas diversa CDC 2478-85]
MNPLVELKDVSLAFEGRTVLDKVSFSLEKGKITTLVGPNGAGKSTLSKLVLGLLTPGSGSITRVPRLRIGYVPQKIYLDPTLPLTVERFLNLARGARRSIPEVLARVGATHLQGDRMQQLSGGELQRVLLARALRVEPELLVLDEPVQGVDVSGQVELYALISELARELDCAVLMVSHDLHLVMASTHEVICLNGHVCCHGAPESVARHPEFARLFGRPEQEQLAVYTHHHHCDGEHHHHHDTPIIRIPSRQE